VLVLLLLLLLLLFSGIGHFLGYVDFDYMVVTVCSGEVSGKIVSVKGLQTDVVGIGNCDVVRDEGIS
jgi:hypothetical protein